MTWTECAEDEAPALDFRSVHSRHRLRDHLKNINYHKFYYNFMQTKAYYTLFSEMSHFKSSFVRSRPPHI